MSEDNATLLTLPRLRSGRCSYALRAPNRNILAGTDGTFRTAAFRISFDIHHASLLDDLIRPQQERWRDREAERLGGLEVDHELELRRLLNRKL